MRAWSWCGISVFVVWDRHLLCVSSSINETFPGRSTQLYESLAWFTLHMLNSYVSCSSYFCTWILKKFCVIVCILRQMVYLLQRLFKFWNITDATGFAQVYFPVELTTALQRNQTRKRQVDESVIRDMLNRLECPCVEISWQKYTATWISENWNQSCLWVPNTWLK